jgi:hypothetical protein
MMSLLDMAEARTRTPSSSRRHFHSRVRQTRWRCGCGRRAHQPWRRCEHGRRARRATTTIHTLASHDRGTDVDTELASHDRGANAGVDLVVPPPPFTCSPATTEARTRTPSMLCLHLHSRARLPPPPFTCSPTTTEAQTWTSSSPRRQLQGYARQLWGTDIPRVH